MTTGRAEPRSMTLVDIMALALGVALAFPFRPNINRHAYDPGWVLLVLEVAWFFGMATMGTSVVVVGRLWRYARGPRPAEWLAILTTVAAIQADALIEPVDLAMLHLPSFAIKWMKTHAVYRWTMGSLAMAVVLGGLGLLRLGRSTLTPWLRSVGLALVAGLAMAGPIAVIYLHGANLLAPSGGFGPGPVPALCWLACRWIAAVPFGLILGIPAIASIIERLQGRAWRWTEWAGVIAPLLMLFVLSPLLRGNFPLPSVWWAAERGIVAAWFLGVGLLSWFAVVKLGPWWLRGWGDHPGRESS